MALTLTLEQISRMSQEQLIDAYRHGYQLEELAFPGVYPDENKIIPYSPRRKFGFTSPTSETTDKIIKLESMENMSIDQIVELYKNGYRIEDTSPTMATTQGGVYIGTGALLLGIGIVALIYYLK